MFPRPAPVEPKLAQVLGTLSHLLDLGAGRAPGHALRSCWIGMWLARALRVRDEELYDLYYALLLADAGRRRDGDRAQVERAGLVRRVGRLLRLARGEDRRADARSRERGEAAAALSRRLGFGRGVARALRALDERWNGGGRPEHGAGRALPRSAQGALMATEISLLHARGDRVAAEQGVRARRGAWFDPELVDVFDVVTLNPEMWNGLRAADLQERVRACEPPVFVVTLTDERLDRIAAAFGLVLDTLGPFGAGRAERVGTLACAIGRELGLSSERVRWLGRSARLHDAAALPGCDEGLRERLDPFRDLARSRGQGFSAVKESSGAALEARVAVVAAEYDARVATAGGREPLSREAALAELEGLRGTHLDPNGLDALVRVVRASGRVRAA